MMKFIAVLAGAMLALSSGQILADAAFEGAGSTASLNCDGGTARVEGAGNMVDVTGQCTRLEVVGDGNAVTVELAAGGSISVEGAANAVTWTTADGGEAIVRLEGFGNLVERAN